MFIPPATLLSLSAGLEDRHVLPAHQARCSGHPVHRGQDKAQGEEDGSSRERNIQFGEQHGRHGLLPGQQGRMSHVQRLGVVAMVMMMLHGGCRRNLVRIAQEIVELIFEGEKVFF